MALWKKGKKQGGFFCQKKKTKQNINYDSESAHSLLFLMEFKFGSVGFLVQKGKAAQEPKAQTAGCHRSSLAWSMPISVATPHWTGY